MKPANWNNMSVDERTDYANALLRSHRGSYLLAQGMYEAVKVLKKKPIKQREVSNIEDMEILLEMLFPVFVGIFNLNTHKK